LLANLNIGGHELETPVILSRDFFVYKLIFERPKSNHPAAEINTGKNPEKFSQEYVVWKDNLHWYILYMLLNDHIRPIAAINKCP